MVEEDLRRLRPAIRDKADRIWRSFLASDEKERALIRRSVESLHSAFVDDYTREKIVLVPPDRLEHLAGDHPIGQVWYAGEALYPFAIQERELIEHVGVFGRTGAGKTSLVRGLLLSLLKSKTPFCVFDWKGTFDLPEAVQAYQPGSESCPLHFNPLDLSGIHREDHKTYIRQVVELFIGSYLEGLRLLTTQGVEYLLLRAIDKLLESTGRATFQDVYDYVSRYQGRARETEWKVSCLTFLYKLATGPLRLVMMEKSSAIGDLVSAPSLVELQNIGNSSDKSFFVRSLLLRLYYHYRDLGPSKDLRLLCVLEEAHNVLLRDYHGRESVVDMMFRQVREFGVSMCLVDQHPSLISPTALGTYCTICFNLKLAQDREAMASALALRHSEYLSGLPPRFAIVKLQDRFLTPFLIRTVDVPRQVRSSRGSGRGDHAIDIRVSSPPKGAVRAPIPDSGLVRQILKKRERPTMQEVMLVHIYVFPLKPTTVRYDELNLNEYQGNRLRKAILEVGLIRAIPRPQLTGRSVILEPTRKGLGWLARLGYTSGSPKMGGIGHGYWKRRIAEELRQKGIEVKLEHHIGQKQSVDVVAFANGRQVGIEVESGRRNPSQIIQNQQKCEGKLDGMVTFLADSRMLRSLVRLSPSCPVSTSVRECLDNVERMLRGDGA